MVEKACHCDMGLGVELPWHRHPVVGVNLHRQGDLGRISYDYDEMVPVVDWKAVAKAVGWRVTVHRPVPGMYG